MGGVGGGGAVRNILYSMLWKAPMLTVVNKREESTSPPQGSSPSRCVFSSVRVCLILDRGETSARLVEEMLARSALQRRRPAVPRPGSPAEILSGRNGRRSLEGILSPGGNSSSHGGLVLWPSVRTRLRHGWSGGTRGPLGHRARHALVRQRQHRHRL